MVAGEDAAQHMDAHRTPTRGPTEFTMARARLGVGLCRFPASVATPTCSSRTLALDDAKIEGVQSALLPNITSGRWPFQRGLPLHFLPPPASLNWPIANQMTHEDRH